MRRDEHRLKSEETLRARCEFDPSLPINQRRDEIATAIRDHQVVVLCGQTGSGKTTQLPKICLSLGLGQRGIIGHTQPRRLAARAVAARIAEELRVSPMSEAVGVKVRFEDRTGPGTVIKLMTDGTLLAETQGDPLLSAYSAIIIDEAHERSLNIDFLLGILRRVLARRKDLKVIVTSATIDPKKFAEHFAPVVGGAGTVPVIEVSGRMFHVEHRYVSSHSTGADLTKIEPELVGDAVDELLGPRGCGGDVLVFLPGEKEIRACQTHLRRTLGDSVDVLALMSRMSSEEQDRIFHVGARRRVILSTNIAETSLTVPGIGGVVDTGLARISRYDHRTRVQTLPIERISRASAAQRSGRCGRVSEGVCIRLYERADFDARAEFTEPEIRRSNLASMILQSKVLGLGPLEDFAFLERPDAGMLRDGYRLLWELGALSSSEGDGELTAIGRRLAGLPVDPKIGRMVLAAEELGCLADVLVLAAALSIQDPRERPMGREPQADAAQAVFRDGSSDFVSLLNLWREYHARDERGGGGGGFAWAREHYVNGVRMREWVEVWEQLRSIAQEIGLAGAARDRSGHDGADVASKAGRERLHRALLTGLVGSACCRDEAGGGFEYRAARGVRCSIHPGSVLFKRSPKWIMAGEVVQTTKNYARCCAPIEPEWVEAVAPHVFERQMSDVHFDREAGEARGFERVSMAGLVIVPRRSVAVAIADPARARELLIEKGLCAADGGAELLGAAAFAAHNRAMFAWADGVRARVRDRSVVKGEREVAAFFERVLPRDVVDVRTLRAWLAREAGADARLRLSRADVVVDAADVERRAGPERFPEMIELGGEPNAGRFEYALAPGKDEDGLTLVIGLLALAALRDERAAWLVPGMLCERVLAMIKGLGKDQRLALERARGDLGTLAAEAAEVMTFGQGDLCAALSEAVEVLCGVRISVEQWRAIERGVPGFCVMNVRVVDDAGRVLASGRDMGQIRGKLAGRLAKAQAEAARARFAQDGLTAWTFGDVPTAVEEDEDGVRWYPTVIDMGGSVSLSLAGSAEDARVMSKGGVRRLFVLACSEELGHRIEALGTWETMKQQYKSLGSVEELMDGLMCQVCERAFMSGQAEVRDRAVFEERLSGGWGRLGQVTFEVADLVSRTLEPRALVARRIGGGTPRLWAASIADIREQAAYLMPPGFLGLVAYERLREYPKYARAMWERLLKLREDGSGVEKEALATIGPVWKKFTLWIARRQAALREEVGGAGAGGAGGAGAGGGEVRGRVRAALPTGRRQTVVINADAAVWAMQPGALAAEVEQYRWACEELRVGLFAPELGGTVKVPGGL